MRGTNKVGEGERPEEGPEREGLVDEPWVLRLVVADERNVAVRDVRFKRLDTSRFQNKVFRKENNNEG